MELSEAKEILKSIDIIDLRETHDVTDETYNEAIDTVLKALDNSIPKEKIEKKIEDLENRIWKGSYVRGEKILVLRELLEQEIEE